MVPKDYQWIYDFTTKARNLYPHGNITYVPIVCSPIICECAATGPLVYISKNVGYSYDDSSNLFRDGTCSIDPRLDWERAFAVASMARTNLCGCYDDQHPHGVDLLFYFAEWVVWFTQFIDFGRILDS